MGTHEFIMSLTIAIFMWLVMIIVTPILRKRREKKPLLKIKDKKLRHLVAWLQKSNLAWNVVVDEHIIGRRLLLRQLNDFFP
jgi:hypothetical protein